jgi:hypothetical protein
MKIKIICFDLDNTLCITKKNYYNKSRPVKKNIKFVNNLYDNGYIIKIFTSRFMGRSNENRILAKRRGFEMTKKQLKRWNLKYHKLIFGKPTYDILVDDKAYGHNRNWLKKISIVLKHKE